MNTKILIKSVHELPWGVKDDRLPPPDSVIEMELRNSHPSVHNAIRRIVLNSIGVDALYVVDMSSDDDYVNIDETILRMNLMPIYQKTGIKKVELEYTNRTSTQKVVYAADCTVAGKAIGSVIVGNPRITTLRAGKTIRATAEIVNDVAEHGVQFRSTGSFAARGLDYCNVPVMPKTGLPRDRWMSVSDVPGYKPGEQLLMIEKGGEPKYKVHESVRIIRVDKFPPEYSSTSARDSNFQLAFRFGPQWAPKEVVAEAAKTIASKFGQLRDQVDTGAIGIELVDGVQVITLGKVDIAYGNLIKMMIFDMINGIQVGSTIFNGVCIVRLCHSDAKKLLISAIDKNGELFARLSKIE